MMWGWSTIAVLLKKLAFLRAEDVSIAEGKNVVLGTVTGTTFGTAAAQKMGFWGIAGVIQPTHVADPAGGTTVDAEARTAIIAILSRLETVGMFASS